MAPVQRSVVFQCALVLALARACCSLPTMVTTLAGNRTRNFANGIGTNALFGWSAGVAVNSSGYVFVADTSNDRIRVIAPSGTVTTLAGGGIPPTGSIEYFADGTGTNAIFNSPFGAAVNSSGYVYVSDRTNLVIRIISPGGSVTTFAGGGQFPSGPYTGHYVDGVGTNVRFYGPAGVALNSSGHVIVADADNYAIRIVAPDGTVTTLAGNDTSGFTDGTGMNAQFNGPSGVAVNSSGHVFVADTVNSAIRVIAPGGIVTMLAGGTRGFADGIGTSAKFQFPYGLAVHSSGYVYVADTFNHAIRVIAPGGIVTTLAGNGTSGFTDGIGTNAQFNSPYGVAVDSSGNVVYVTDTSNYLIRKISYPPPPSPPPPSPPPPKP